MADDPAEPGRKRNGKHCARRRIVQHEASKYNSGKRNLCCGVHLSAARRGASGHETDIVRRLHGDVRAAR